MRPQPPKPSLTRHRPIVVAGVEEQEQADYARQLGTSPGHLNALCRSRFRRSCCDWIRRRLTLEARRLLLYSDLTAAEIADRLGFADPAYFARFFRREAGAAPTSYRTDRRFA